MGNNAPPARLPPSLRSLLLLLLSLAALPAAATLLPPGSISGQPNNHRADQFPSAADPSQQLADSNWPQLTRIILQGLDSITPEETHALYSRVIDLQHAQWWPEQQFFLRAVALLGILFTLTTLIANRRLQHRLATQTNTLNQQLSERNQLEHKLRQLNTTDTLTGILNRHSTLEILRKELGRHHRYRSPLCVALFDIDHLSRVNGSFGHTAGDSVLKQLAGIFTRELRELDTFGQIGGEEFLAILPQTKTPQAERAAERIRRAVEQMQVRIDTGQRLRLTVSVGVASADPAIRQIEELLQQSALAMAAAKQRGRNQVAIFEPVLAN